MKKAWTAAALAIGSLAWSVPGMAHDSGDSAPQCGPQTLRGSYVLAGSGFQIVNGVAQPKALIEQIEFDGQTNAITPNAINSINGVLNVSGRGAGTYTLESDCTGTITFSNGIAHKVYMDPDGHRGWTLLTNFIGNPNPLNQVFPGTLTRVWPSKDRDDRN